MVEGEPSLAQCAMAIVFFAMYRIATLEEER